MKRSPRIRDVSVQYPVHLALTDPDRQRIQRIMLATPWPKSIAEPEEVFLPYRVQHFYQRALDNLVLKRRHTPSELHSGPTVLWGLPKLSIRFTRCGGGASSF